MKDLYEDFTTLRWVRWTKRQPEFNGSVICRWNGKWISDAVVKDKQLLILSGNKTDYHIENGKVIADYNEGQLKLLEDVYWLEEIIDGEGFEKYRDTL